MISEASSLPSKSGRLPTLISWLNAFQASSLELMHYTDGLKGCGVFFESKLREVFQSILLMVARLLTQTESANLAGAVIQAFNCKFKAHDFQFLSEAVRIFPLLFRGS